MATTTPETDTAAELRAILVEPQEFFKGRGYVRRDVEARIEIAKLAQMELLNKNLAAICAAIRNKGVG